MRFMRKMPLLAMREGAERDTESPSAVMLIREEWKVYRVGGKNFSPECPPA